KYLIFFFDCALLFTIPHIKIYLFPTGDTNTCQVTVMQPRYKEAGESADTVTLPCTFSALGCSPAEPQALWFRFFTNRHEDLCTPKCTDAHKFQVHTSPKSVSLQISNLTPNDSAVYFCGIAFSDSWSPHSKQTGGGTVLVKTGAEKHNTENLTSMIITLSLLLLYSIVVFTILILHKKISSGRKIFQAIAQELQKQRYAEDCQQPDHLEDDTVYQNR
ncbi:IGSF6 protein, partial [Nothoprocta ornata]|nr:IGSF6 protein [Nothoprocta pentlandii]NWX95496.1 IGSF6 protein [Nothoprocta ornata]